MTEAIKLFIEAELNYALSGFDRMLTSACDVLTGGLSATLWWTVVSMSNALVPFCNIIIGICLLIELAQIASKVDIIKWEHGLKIGVKMALSKVCIEVAPTFLKACYNQAILFIDYLAHSRTYLDACLGLTVTSHITTYMQDIDTLGEAISLLPVAVILNMGIKICGLLITVMAYGRIFEILMYLLVSPIPCAFFPLGNGNGEGYSRITTNFFKNFIAVCLQGLLQYVCILLYGTIVKDAHNTMLAESLASGATGGTMISDLCWDMLLFAIVLVMAIAKCGSWAKSMIDAH